MKTLKSYLGKDLKLSKAEDAKQQLMTFSDIIDFI
jgi:hypothetical protein